MARGSTLYFDSDANGANGVTEGVGGTSYNWVPGTTPTFFGGTAVDVFTGPADIAQFGNGGAISGSPVSVNVGAGPVNGLIFGATAGNGYMLGNSTAPAILTVGGGGMVVSSGAQATTVGDANLSLALSAAQSFLNGSANLLTIGGAVDNGGNTLTLTTTSTGGITLNGVVSGAGGLTVNGYASANPGAAALTVANTYSGATTVNAGGVLKLDFTAAGAPTDNIINNTANSSSLALNGGTLILLGNTGTNTQQFNGTTIGSGASAITLTQGGATTLSVSLGTISQTTGGTLNFSVPPSTGGVIATTATALNSGLLGPWATVGAPAALSYATINGSNQIVAYTGANQAATAAALTDTTGTTNYDLAVATGTVPATFSGNTIRYTGGAGTTAPGATGFTVNGLMNAGSGLWTIGTNAITIGANKELVITGDTQGITISSNIKDNAAGASSLTYSGAGTLTLGTAVKTYTGTTTVNSGTVTLSLANVLNSASGIVVNGGVLGTSTFAQSVNFVRLRGGSITGSTGGIITSATAYDVQNGSISAILAGTAGLNKTTAGTVVLSGVNTYSGGTNISAGTLSFSAQANLGSTTTNSVTLGTAAGTATLLYTGATGTVAQPIILAAPTGSSTGNVIQASTAGATLSLSGVISGGPGNSSQAAPGSNVAFTVKGPGVVAPTNAANTFTGDIVVDGGIYNVANLTSWGGATVASSTSHMITLTNGGKLAATATVNPGASTTTTYDLIRIGSGGGIIDAVSGATVQLDDAGQFSGMGDLTKTGLGTLLLQNAYVYTGSNINVNGGVVQVGNATGMGTVGTVNLGDTTGSTAATFTIGTNGAAAVTIANTTALVVRSGSSGVKTIRSTNSTGSSIFNGSVTLNDNVTFDAVAGGTLSIPNGLNDGGVARTITKITAGNLSIGGTSSLVAGSTFVVNGGSLIAASTGGFGSNNVAITVGGSGSVSGRVAYNVAGTYSNNITSSSLGVSGSGILGGPASGTVTYNGTFTINANTTAGGDVDGGGGTLIINGPLVLNSPVNIFTHRAGTVTYNTPISGTAVNPTFSVSVGTANWGASDIFPGGSALTMATTAATSSILNLNGFNQTFSSVTLGFAGANAATINTGTGTLTLGGNVTVDPGSTSASTISGNLNLGGATRTFTMADAAAGVELTVSAVISNGGISKTGLASSLSPGPIRSPARP